MLRYADAMWGIAAAVKTRSHSPVPVVLAPQGGAAAAAAKAACRPGQRKLRLVDRPTTTRNVRVVGDQGRRLVS